MVSHDKESGITRRRALQTMSLGAVLSADCVDRRGLFTNDPNPGATSDCDSDLVPMSEQFDQITDGASNGFRLTVSEKNSQRGDEITIRLENTTDTEQNAASKPRYAIQQKRDDTWRDMLWVATLDVAGASSVHAPGEGFTWTVTLTQEGLSQDHQVCFDVTPGIYRFIYWGVPEPVPAVRFTIQPPNTANYELPNTTRRDIRRL